MESSSTNPGSSPGDDDHNMSVDESDAVTALKNIARQRARRAGTNVVHPIFMKDDPSLHSAAFDSVTSSFVSLSEMPLDLLVPPKFKSKRLPRPGRSLPVMSSPPRLPSQKDQLDWKVPPFISPWKNPRGYTIPLDKRQRPSEGGDFTESLRAAEVMARLMEMRALVGRREQELRRLAFSARAERAAKAVVPAAPPVSVTEDPEDEKPKAKHGDSDICGAHADEQLEVTESLRAAEVKARLMEMRAKLVLRREQELRRLDASARAEMAAKAVVPAAAPPVSVTEVLEDEKPKAKHGDSDICGAHADEQLEKVTMKTDEGTPARAAGKRERPVELDEPEESDDPFDLDQFMAKFATLGMDEFDLDELLRSMLHIK